MLVSGTYEVNVQDYSVMPATSFTLDVSSGIGGYANGYIIPANLTVGQTILGEAATVQTIADWHGRKAIVANATAPFMGFEAQVYWDQKNWSASGDLRLGSRDNILDFVG